MAVTHSEVIEEETDFDEWATNAGTIGDDLTRLRALIARAPSEVQSWLRPRQLGSRLVFTLTEGIVIGYQKTKSGVMA